MKNRAVRERNRGFTLLEVMIAILIFFVIISALFSSFKAFVTTSDEVRANLTYNEKVRNVLRRIHWDLRSLFVLQEPRYQKPGFDSDPDPFRFLGKEERVGELTVSSLVFASLAHAGVGSDLRSGAARIGYYVKENKDRGYDLFRADALYPFPGQVESCRDPLLCRGISGFEVLYIDAEGDEHRDWDSDTKEFDYAFPSDIRLKIIFASDRGDQVFQTLIHLDSGRLPIE
ncbi:PulJ/GspJ family protein [Desulfospira joergensenii]|uniref:PulJ/GspJ family protein n=1 Tax=Desulfospira joergensenii TaxID=53329 RepID=UPI001376E586|nr:prepilin-type N-terminal cleavage/methylation domain-containing protein [Desulfospira joergensenii]